MRKLITFLAAWAAVGAAAQVNLGSAVDYVKSHFTLNGYAQAGWDYDSESDPNNEFTVRRIILMGDYRINDHWNAFIMTEFKAMSLHEYWVNYRPTPWMNIKLGQFKTPFTLENPISPAVMEMITQMSAPTLWMVGGGSPLMMPGGAGRDLGLTVYGDAGRYVSYDLAVMNGAGRNRSDDNSWKDFVGRLTLHPVKGLDLSGSVILGKGSLATVAAHDDDYQGPPTGNYTRNRYAAGFQPKTAPVNVRGEWMWSKDDDLKCNGGYATVQVSNVGVRGLDLVASADYLDVEDQKLSRYQAGVQYWFYKKCRVQLGYMYTDCHDWDKSSHSVLTQVQVAF